MTDANDRVRKVRLVGSGAVGAALLLAAPWVGWWTLALFALVLLNFFVVELRLRRSEHPERASAQAIVVTMLLIGAGVALSGGPHSVALPWIVLPAAMAAARFRPQVVIAGVALTVAIVLAATFGGDPHATLADPAPLAATLALLVGVVSIVWALQAAELHHRGEAMIDPLTGLFNRTALMPRFAELSHQARLTDQPVCLLLCDLDNFKAINDEHGHDRGDAALRDMAYELRKRLHSFDLVYRYGGEEFLVVLPGLGSEAGREVAERLRGAVERVRPAGIDVTVSIGVSAARGARVAYEPLFKAADEALYHAKRGGRNRVTTADELARETAASAIDASDRVDASRVLEPAGRTALIS